MMEIIGHSVQPPTFFLQHGDRPFKQRGIVCFEADNTAGYKNIRVAPQERRGCQAEFRIPALRPGVAEIQINPFHFTRSKN